MATLYELTAEYAELERAMSDDIAGNLDELLEAAAATETEFESKAENYAKLIRNLDAEAYVLKEEEARLRMRRQTIERNIDWLKNTLKNAMKLTGKEKFTKGVFKFSIRKNGGKQPVILDVLEEDLPDELVKVTRKADNDAIRKYIEETGDVTYAHLGERGDSVSIR